MGGLSTKTRCTRSNSIIDVKISLQSTNDIVVGQEELPMMFVSPRKQSVSDEEIRTACLRDVREQISRCLVYAEAAVRSSLDVRE
ncbi:hypothetical protein Tco_0710014 [Tanacetum coccineum]